MKTRINVAAFSGAIRENSVGGSLIHAHSPYRDSVIWGAVPRSPSFLPFLCVGPALSLFSLIIASENPSSRLLQSAQGGASGLSGVPDRAYWEGLGCRMPQPVSSWSLCWSRLCRCCSTGIPGFPTTPGSHSPNFPASRISCPPHAPPPHLTLNSEISSSLRHGPLVSSHFPGNTEAGIVHRGQGNSSEV